MEVTQNGFESSQTCYLVSPLKLACLVDTLFCVNTYIHADIYMVQVSDCVVAVL